MTAEPDGFGAFTHQLNQAVDYFRRFFCRSVTVVHHNDTDGITSGAILKKALERQGCEVENLPIERVHPAFLPLIHTADRRLVFYADLGGQSAARIGEAASEGTGVIILDHHPPAKTDVGGVCQVNPELCDIDGDTDVSAAAVAFFWSQALDEKNADLAHLAVIGSIGDRQLVNGALRGLNRLAADIALQSGAMITMSDGPDPFAFAGFNNMGGEEIARRIVDMAVNGYYRGGAQLAIEFCLNGPDLACDRFGSEMRRLQAERFSAEMERLRSGGISHSGHLQWVDVEKRFFPLGLKAIGIFCEQVREYEPIYSDRYIVGFQDFPDEIPILGKIDAGEVKVSMRVPPALKEKIDAGLCPNLVEILPPAAAKAGGFAEGCHRFAAACSLPGSRKKELISALNESVADWTGRL
jgi:hypothetical protein